jgi:NADH-quinone oxidoreductase subunit G
MAAVSLLKEGNRASMADVRGADCIVIVDCDLLEEGPMMALAVRQAWRAGGHIFAIGSVGENLEKALSIFVTKVDSLADVKFAEYRNPVVAFGMRSGIPPALATIAAGIVKFAVLLAGPNAFGAALLAREYEQRGFTRGKLQGIIAVEADIKPVLLEGIPFVAAIDWRLTETVVRSDVFLPATAWVESDGTFINYEGRAQRFRKVMNPGLPLKGLDQSLHPPRIHRKTPPDGDSRPAWVILADIVERLGGERIENPLTGRWENLRELDPESEGIKVL